MSGEIIAILAVGVALAGLILTSIRGLRQDIRQDMARLEFSLSAVGPTLPEPRQASPIDDGSTSHDRRSSKKARY